jgi:hypothetical protein
MKDILWLTRSNLFTKRLEPPAAKQEVSCKRRKSISRNANTARTRSRRKNCGISSATIPPAFFEYPHTALSRKEHEAETTFERRGDQAHAQRSELAETPGDHQRKEKADGFQRSRSQSIALNNLSLVSMNNRHLGCLQVFNPNVIMTKVGP